MIPVALATVPLTSAITVAIINSRATPYSALSDRVMKLETQIAEWGAKIENLESERTGHRSLIRAMSDFIDLHIPATIPRPFGRPPWL